MNKQKKITLKKLETIQWNKNVCQIIMYVHSNRIERYRQICTTSANCTVNSVCFVFFCSLAFGVRAKMSISDKHMQRERHLQLTRQDSKCTQI